jgi:hypothetical protein
MAAAILQVLASDRQPIDSNWLDQFGLEAATHNYLNILGITQTH